MTTAQTFGVRLQYSRTLGRGEGIGGTGFRIPVAMARGNGDLLYVINRVYDNRPERRRVTILTVDEEYVGEFNRGYHGTPDTTAAHVPPNEMVWPSDISVSKGGNLYISDEWLNRITVFSEEGEYRFMWGEPGSGPGQFNGPSGLAVDPQENLLVVDSGNHRVQKFTKEGRFLSAWGQGGSGPGELNMPWGIAVDGNGNVFVADWRNDRIQKFSPDGDFLMAFGSTGSGEGQFKRPTSVAVDSEGYIYVADRENDRLQVFDPEGHFITLSHGEATISNWAKAKLDASPDQWKQREVAQGLEREKLFYSPIAVDVDQDGRVFVLESARYRIQVFRRIAPLFLGTHL
jgi:DNA-binding beta-propeller fold protein YncE